MSSDKTIYKNFRPTRLYIKQHSITGLKYFGKSVRPDLEQYKGSGSYWYRHITKHGRHHVVNLWVSDWFYDPIEIQEFALAFSEIFDIVNSDEWANLTPENGKGVNNFKHSEDTREKISVKAKARYQNEEWLNTVGKETGEKISNILSDPEWKETTGKETAKRVSDLMNSQEWQETTGKELIRKQKETTSKPEWQETVGKPQAENHSKLFKNKQWIEEVGNERSRKLSEKSQTYWNDEEWRNTKGKEGIEKRSKLVKTKEYRDKHYKTCEHCGQYRDPGNFKKSHGDRCKHKPQ